MSIEIYGEVDAETIYPTRFRLEHLPQRSTGLMVHFRKPYDRAGYDYGGAGGWPCVQLRRAEDDYVLVYFTYEEEDEIMLSYLPEWLQSSELVWELREPKED